MESKAFTCAITGSNGYVGSITAAGLREQGASIVGFNRRMDADSTVDRVVRYVLSEDVAPDQFIGIDALVHCAWEFGAHTWSEIKRTNVDGSLRLFASAHAAGVRRLIFISTVSAFEGCRSMYGRAKLAVERGGEPYGVISVRPGLVYDDDRPRGVVGALSRLVELSPVVPLIGNGRQILYPCHADDLARLMYVLCVSSRPPARPVVAASATGLSFKQILADVAARKGKRVVFVPMPYRLVLAALRSAERLGLKTRLRSDSLVSLVNQSDFLDFAELRATGVPFRDMTPSVRRA